LSSLRLGDFSLSSFSFLGGERSLCAVLLSRLSSSRRLFTSGLRSRCLSSRSFFTSFSFFFPFELFFDFFLAFSSSDEELEDEPSLSESEEESDELLDVLSFLFLFFSAFLVFFFSFSFFFVAGILLSPLTLVLSHSRLARCAHSASLSPQEEARSMPNTLPT